MSEGRPKPERAPRLTKEAVIEHLRSNPQELGPYQEWIEAREAEIEDIHEPYEKDAAQNDLTFEMGEICREAGFLESARENFETALQQAFDNMRLDPERYWRAHEALAALPKPS